MEYWQPKIEKLKRKQLEELQLKRLKKTLILFIKKFRGYMLRRALAANPPSWATR